MKCPHLHRRNNTLYFRLSVPHRFHSILHVRELTQTLQTQNYQEAVPACYELAGKAKELFLYLDKNMHDDYDLELLIQAVAEIEAEEKKEISLLPPLAQRIIAEKEIAVAAARRREIQSELRIKADAFDKLQNFVLCTAPAEIEVVVGPLLSIVVSDFLKRYNPLKADMLDKLTGVLPIFTELVGDKSINQILQADINYFFDEVQKLPVRRDVKKFKGMGIKKMIIANAGAPCIAEKTFISTYRACVSVFIDWAIVNYMDQGFPGLSVKGAEYRGLRASGLNKQRAIRPDELVRLFSHPKMKEYASNIKTAHYCWLPLIGLYTGCRINEACQLNPFTDILKDADTGIYYFLFSEETESSVDIKKSIKTNKTRVAPIQSVLLDLGVLGYVEAVKAGDHKAIFPEWKPRGGKASANATKWFVRYLDEIGLRDDSEGAKLSGFHGFRHTFVTHGLDNKIAGTLQITGHQTEVVDGFGKISKVARGYWTQNVTDNILEKKETIERFDFGLNFYRPVC